MIQDASYTVTYRTPAGRCGERVVRGAKLVAVINAMRDKGYTFITVL